jgi:hypothetical protein
MFFNAVSFTRGVKGNDSFRREVNGLEVMLGSYATGSGGVTLGGRRDRDLGPSGPGGQVG